MGHWHQEEIRNALDRRGWKIVAEHPGDDYAISGSWELHRSTIKPPIFIDFYGFDDMVCLPMAQSYACHARSNSSVSLYFRKRRSRHIWDEELSAFIEGIEKIDSGLLTDNVTESEVVS